jgi:hypothetical protein
MKSEELMNVVFDLCLSQDYGSNLNHKAPSGDQMFPFCCFKGIFWAQLSNVFACSIFQLGAFLEGAE